MHKATSALKPLLIKEVNHTCGPKPLKPQPREYPIAFGKRAVEICRDLKAQRRWCPEIPGTVPEALDVFMGLPWQDAGLAALFTVAARP